MKTQIDPRHIIPVDADYIYDNILGVAACISEDSQVYHSGIFIRYNRSNYLLHFDGRDVEFLEIKNSTTCFFKSLPFVPKDMIPSTYFLFQRLSMSKKPSYGYFYDGSCYDATSLDFLDEYEMPEIMSCVGFCLNVLKTVLNRKDFIKYTEWHYHNGITNDDILKFFEKNLKKNPDLSLEEFAKYVRRILPIEYFTAGFSGAIPVSKAFTDANVKETKKLLLEKAIA